MISSSSTKYARALADVAFEEGRAEATQQELSGFLDLVTQNEELRRTLSTPAFPLVIKQGVAREVSTRTGLSTISRNFVLLLLERNRLHQLDEILEAYQAVLDQKAGVARVEVYSAHSLSAATRDRLTESMRAVTNRQVRVTFQVDEDLIGGVRIQVGSIVFDGSVKTELERLERELKV